MAAIVGGARSFGGTSEKITFSNTTALRFTGPFSIACWVYLTSISAGNQTVYVQPSGATWVSPFARYCLRITNANVVQGWINDGSVGSNATTGVTALSANTWYHIGLLYDQVNLSAMLNGVSDHDTALTSAVTTNSANSPTCGNNTATEFVHGRVADLALWNTNLTTAEYAALAAGERPSKVRFGNCVLWCPMWGIASPEPDLSGQQNNGALTTTATAFGPPVRPITWTVPNIPGTRR
jgi:hypothetical protein